METESSKNEIIVLEPAETEEIEKDTSWVCSKCGTVLDSEYEFCSKCGTPKVFKCASCGAVLTQDQEYCPKCGKKVGTAKEKIVSTIKEGNEKVKSNKKLFPAIGAAVAVIAVIAILAIVLKKPPVNKVLFDEESLELIEGDTDSAVYSFEPSNAKAKELRLESSDEDVATVEKDGTITAVGSGTCTITIYADKKKDSLKISVKSEVESYLEDGQYEKAYECAETEDERLSVIAENLAAVESAFAVDNLKDPSSFVLHDAYYLDKDKYLVLEISGNNSYGAAVTNYWLFTWDYDDKAWEYFTSVSDLVDDEIKSYDDADDKIEKLYDNLGRDKIRTTKSKGIELSKAAISRINALFESDTLDSVELLEDNSGTI